MLRFAALILISFTMIFPFLTNADETTKVYEEIVISNKLKRVLASEMKVLQQHMNSLAASVPAGRFTEIAATSEEIGKRDILEKRLSDKERTELNNILPSEYKIFEHELFRAAEMLNKASENNNPQFVSFFYSKLNESCIMCHSIYAKERFPDFKNTH